MTKFPFTTRVCPVCGKTFIPAALHQYHTAMHGRKRLVCTYTCEQKAKIGGDHCGSRKVIRE